MRRFPETDADEVTDTPEAPPRPRKRPADKRRRFPDHSPSPVPTDRASSLENTPDGHDG